MIELPSLSECPIHKEVPPKCIADCKICWSRFYFQFEFQPIIDRMNNVVKEYEDRITYELLNLNLIGQGWVLQSSKLMPLVGKEHLVYTRSHGIVRAWVYSHDSPNAWVDLKANYIEDAIAWKLPI